MTSPTPPDPIQPLRSARLYLRPLEPEDATTVAGWYRDARILTLMGELPGSIDRRRARLEASVASQGEDHFAFVICRIGDDAPIGRADLFDLDLRQGSAQLGITIGIPALWGRGLGTEAVEVLEDFAFGQLRLERLWLATDAENLRARAAYAKAGFVEEGILRRSYYQDGRFVDEVRMALLHDEWAAQTRRRSWELVAEAVEAEREP